MRALLNVETKIVYMNSKSPYLLHENRLADVIAAIQQHPEFFRLDRQREKASLVWRRQYPKVYNVDTQAKITKEEYDNLLEPQKLRISRNPLEAETIKALVQTAIDLHSRALERLQDRRWGITLAASTIGGLIGAIPGGLVG